MFYFSIKGTKKRLVDLCIPYNVFKPDQSLFLKNINKMTFPDLYNFKERKKMLPLIISIYRLR